MTALLSDLRQRMDASPYQGYVYAYPHKTAYRPLNPARSLTQVWADQSRRDLFLYLHIPFCGMRCGFCNLFTQAKPAESLVTLFLDALERQAIQTRDALPDASFARFAIGGGTPTYLDESGLGRLFDLALNTMGVDATIISTGIEVSPETVTMGKMALLKAVGVERISMGIQSFIETETQNSGRPQRLSDVHAALQMIRQQSFTTLNLDLIYGLPGQTLITWMHSLREALRYTPEELYLYPLYVRPLTGLGRSDKEWDDIRLACYRAARDELRDCGYQQVSMRMFRAPQAQVESGVAYCCQSDGMIGLGCGARSYTRSLHYSGDYAVGAKSIKAILADYVTRDDAAFSHVDYGVELDDAEQRRRWLLQSLFPVAGLNRAHYAERFGVDVLSDFPELGELCELGLVIESTDKITLTDAGIERSDAIGPWLFSTAMLERMEAYELR